VATNDMPAAEVDVSPRLVRSLLADQHADLAGRAISGVANGWDNVIFRLDDDLAVRLPRRAAAARLIEHEQRWLPDLALKLPLPVPSPVRVGAPGRGYPWRWSVTRWFDGSPLAANPPVSRRDIAEQLGGFLAALHQPAPLAAPQNPFRGVALDARAVLFHEHLARVTDIVDAERLRWLWDRALAAEAWPGPPVWLHGDLHPANVVVDRGSIQAVIDFGDLTAGDPATDMAIAWMAFDPKDRDQFRDSIGSVSDSTWERARGWALALGLACLANSADNAMIASIGVTTLRSLLSDASAP
jgi:aminoglycoside phosphotransferase (APT) family kinase protein